MSDMKYLAKINGRTLKMSKREFMDVQDFNYEIKQTKAKLRALFGEPVERGALSKRLAQVEKLYAYLSLMRNDLEILRQEVLEGNKENGSSL